MTATRRDKAILVAGMISDRIGLALLYIVFGPLARDIGLSDNQFGVLIASANVALGVASPYWGRRSQILGRRPVFVIGLSGYALGFLLLAGALQAGMAGWLKPWPLFLVLLAVRLGYGLLAAATQPAATAYLADITDTHRRAQGMALIGVAAGIGTILGPIIGGSLSAVGAVVPLYVAAGLAAVAAAVAHAGLREPAQRVAPVTPVRMRFSDQRVFPYLVGWCLVVLVLTGIQTIMAFYLEDGFSLTGREEVARAASVAFLIMGAAMVLTQAVLLQVVRIAPPRLLRIGFMLLGLALLVLVSARDLVMFYLAFGLLGLGFSALGPGLNAAASINVTDREQGAVAGLLAAAPVLGMVLGPIAGTALYGLDPAWPMVLGAAACAGMGAYF